MSEAISYLAGSQLPVVIANIMRAGPGLGILPGQADYFKRPRVEVMVTITAWFWPLGRSRRRQTWSRTPLNWQITIEIQ